MFPAMESDHPELAPAMERLRADRLTEELEAHLDYEEEQLVPLLG
ncbi:hypothetical protein [Nonomuraea longispora]|nr:hypothetical protein [Nonomuraea longispora]